MPAKKPTETFNDSRFAPRVTHIAPTPSKPSPRASQGSTGMVYDEEEMIKRGSAVGPITREMIDLCKKVYSDKLDWWPDYLPEARRILKVGTWDDQKEKK